MGSSFEFITGFESTYIFGSGRDVIEMTRHLEVYDEDLRLVQECGLKRLRYSVPWHRVEKVKGVYDWSSVDGAMQSLQHRELDPIVDPLHHTSFPDWLEDGFANPAFGSSYLAFVKAFAQRYPWVKRYTVMNEPFVTTLFCSETGLWYPHKTGQKNFVPMLLNVCRMICNVSNMLIATVPGVVLYHVDTCERHAAADAASQELAALFNERRFIVLDLILGKLDATYPMYRFMVKGGMRAEDLSWFKENATRVDILGLDYYAHSELEWQCNKRVKLTKAAGFFLVAQEYVNRFKLPVMLSETNMRGAVEDRILWLKIMISQCEELQEWLSPQAISFHGFCWYPFVDSTDWDSLVCKARGRVDPQGIYCLDPATKWTDDGRKRRIPSELSELYAKLARGEITGDDLPAYAPKPPVDEWLQCFAHLMPASLAARTQ